jgi:hypothetical protein
VDRRITVGTAGLLLGLVWALWHALVAFLFTYSAMGQSWFLSFTLVYLATLTHYRILMTWVYANTQCALLAVLCMPVSRVGSSWFSRDIADPEPGLAVCFRHVALDRGSRGASNIP